MTAEERRLRDNAARAMNWHRWGPYLSERAWGTVREDYSADGAAWEYFPHEHARSRAYRWNEDGLAGISDRHQRVCFSLALWNERDAILKERLFGLTGTEGNHGEDVKEYYYYLDSTPTHSYMRYLYKYPHAAFPYAQLVSENRSRDRSQPEFELADTAVFDDRRYFDVFVEYAKGDPDDVLMKITVENRADVAAPLRVLPTLWFRNTWSWDETVARPELRALHSPEGLAIVQLDEPLLGTRWLYADQAPELMFTENHTNIPHLFGTPAAGPFKDGINDAVVNGVRTALSAVPRGTKVAAHYARVVPAGGRVELRLRLTDRQPSAFGEGPFDAEFDRIFAVRKAEADEFYATIIPASLSDDAREVMRQSLAGVLWSKQFYHFIVRDWLKGDPTQPVPPGQRLEGRDHEWDHLYNADVISMPDKWEYPWYAAWDLAFHCVPLALVDPDFAKAQLVLLLREWYMHPNGQLPAYEWAFGDVNPPVHAWAAWRVYKIEQKRKGQGDRVFLERVFQKLLLNFTWWVNRKDTEGNNVFQGGFLGLDNIGVFDRSSQLPTGGHIEQSDGTSWMAMYCLNMLAIAMELARENHAYEDLASKFWEHFLYIAHAMDNRGADGISLWDDAEGFYYDVLNLPDNRRQPLKVRSMVGLIPLFAVQTLEPEMLDRLPAFRRRLEWFIANRPDLIEHVACMRTPGHAERRLLAVVSPDRLRRLLQVMLDESEFLSDYGVRALSRRHLAQPFTMTVDGHEHQVGYEPGESSSGLFGGNSNWRGPVWFPVNFLLIEALQKFHHYLGDGFRVECPTGSGRELTLREVATELSQRLTCTFLKNADGRRSVFGDRALFNDDPLWCDLIPFHEYFHGDTGAGVGASHQTGWTALVAKLLQQSGEQPRRKDASLSDRSASASAGVKRDSA